jgi:prefoldin alpha subunit
MDMSNKEVQEKALMYQVFGAQLEELSSHFMAINQKVLEVDMAKNSLDELSKAVEGSDTLVPVGAGCYGFGKLGKKGKFMVEIGGGFVMEKTLPGAIESMDVRKKELMKLQDRVKAELENLRGNMDRIGLELNEMAAGGRPAAARKDDSQEDDGIMVE